MVTWMRWRSRAAAVSHLLSHCPLFGLFGLVGFLPVGLMDDVYDNDTFFLFLINEDFVLYSESAVHFNFTLSATSPSRHRSDDIQLRAQERSQRATSEHIRQPYQ
jgi:hypothetical protein